MNFVLIGASGSGKNYYLDKILECNPSLNKIITYTDRPQRSNETKGVHYHFVSPYHMSRMIARDEMIEFTTYKVANGELWTYGSHVNSFYPQSLNHLIILDPMGYEKIHNKFPRHTVGFIIDRDIEQRKVDYLKRDKKASLDEFNRREKEDIQKFKDARKLPDIYIIDNNDFSKTDQRIKAICDIMGAYTNDVG